MLYRDERKAGQTVWHCERTTSRDQSIIDPERSQLRKVTCHWVEGGDQVRLCGRAGVRNVGVGSIWYRGGIEAGGGVHLEKVMNEESSWPFDTRGIQGAKQ